MVIIITGGIHDGKTTELIRRFENYRGDGYVFIKNMSGSYVSGFDYLRLSDKRTGPLIRKDPSEEVRHWLGPYAFYERAMALIERNMVDMVKAGISPLYLDEIGKLELEGKGFCDLLKTILSELGKDQTLYISTRKEFLNDVIQVFGLEDAEIVRLKERIRSK